MFKCAGVQLLKSFAPKVFTMDSCVSTNIEEQYLYTGPEILANEAKIALSEFSGNTAGSVDLDMDVGFGVASVRLNNPKIKNAINGIKSKRAWDEKTFYIIKMAILLASLGKMMADLDKIIDKLNRWTEGKGVILYGADGNFCSGADLNFANQIGSPELGYAMSTYMNHVLEKFKKLPFITVAYIEGTGKLIIIDNRP